jgi:hypothetical protein
VPAGGDSDDDDDGEGDYDDNFLKQLYVSYNIQGEIYDIDGNLVELSTSSSHDDDNSSDEDGIEDLTSFH